MSISELIDRLEKAATAYHRLVFQASHSERQSDIVLMTHGHLFQQALAALRSIQKDQDNG